MSNYVLAAKAIGIASAFTAAGGIASISWQNVPLLQALPASESLPQTRWLFSRGSHIFPQAAFASAAAFGYAAYAALPRSTNTAADVFRTLVNGSKSSAFVTAAILCFAIGPWTSLAMIPTNFKLMELNENKGGVSSAKSAAVAEQKGGDAVKDSVGGQRNVNEFTDLSGPQRKTKQDSTPEEDRQVRELLSKFNRLNAVRAVLMASGGFVALLAAITP